MSDANQPGPNPQQYDAVPPVPVAPPGAYPVPVGGYQAPTGAYAPPPATSKGSPGLGVASLILGIAALIIVPTIAGVLGGQIGAKAPDFFLNPPADFSDLSGLTPARADVLWVEIAFWVGTFIGLTAIVTGIVAIAKRRGRRQGITGLILAALGPVAFFLAVGIGAGIGAASAQML